MSEEVIQCVLCKKDIEHRTHQGVVYWASGNNAQPVADGRCCDACDCLIVIPYRMASLFGDEKFETSLRSVIEFGKFELEQRLARYEAMNHGEE